MTEDPNSTVIRSNEVNVIPSVTSNVVLYVAPNIVLNVVLLVAPKVVSNIVLNVVQKVVLNVAPNVVPCVIPATWSSRKKKMKTKATPKQTKMGTNINGVI